MGLPSSLDGIADSDCSDATPNEKLLPTELEGVERGEALGLRGALTSFEAARAPSLGESSSKGPIPKRVGWSPANLVTPDAKDCPMWKICIEAFFRIVTSGAAEVGSKHSDFVGSRPATRVRGEPVKVW